MGLPFLALGVIFSFLHTFMAWIRVHYNRVAIQALHLSLGSTVVGWILSLVWSCTNPPPRSDDRV